MTKEIEIETVTILIRKDGNNFCATLDDFIDLQASPAGFGDTKVEAIIGLMAEKEVKEKFEITKEQTCEELGCENGVIYLDPQDSCSCHISPPCPKCTNSQPCPNCG